MTEIYQPPKEPSISEKLRVLAVLALLGGAAAGAITLTHNCLYMDKQLEEIRETPEQKKEREQKEKDEAVIREKILKELSKE